MPRLRRNLFTAVAVFDPASRAGLDMGTLVRAFVWHQYPLRFGMLPVVPGLVSWRAGDGGQGQGKGKGRRQGRR